METMTICQESFHFVKKVRKKKIHVPINRCGIWNIKLVLANYHRSTIVSVCTVCKISERTRYTRDKLYHLFSFFFFFVKNHFMQEKKKNNTIFQRDYMHSLNKYSSSIKSNIKIDRSSFFRTFLQNKNRIEWNTSQPYWNKTTAKRNTY